MDNIKYLIYFILICTVVKYYKLVLNNKLFMIIIIMIDIMITDCYFTPKLQENLECEGDVYCGRNSYCDGKYTYSDGTCQNKKGKNKSCRRNSWCDSNKCKHYNSDGVGNCD